MTDKFMSSLSIKHLAAGAALLLICGLSSCNDFFGKKTDLSFIEVPDTTPIRVAYVPILPEIKGGALPFENPVHMTTGFDRFFYVVDSTQGIFCLDETGGAQGFLPNPQGVNFTYCAQDRNLDLLVIGKKQVTLQGRTLRLSTIWRYSLRDTSGTGVFINLNNAQLVNEMVYPFFLGEDQRANSGDVERVNLTSLGFISGNRYYVTCTSPDPTPGGATFENNSVLLCNLPKQEAKVEAWTQLLISTSDGAKTDYFKRPKALVTLVQPPQNFRLIDGTSEDFIVTANDPNLNLPTRVNWISVTPSSDGPPIYAFRNLAPPQEGSQRYLYTPFRFKDPKALCWVGGGRRQLLVLDRDSVFLFNNNGVEGAPPSRGSSSRSLVNVSFGGTGTSLTQFNDARALAYNNQTLFVVDKGNKRILRFRLTTDID